MFRDILKIIVLSLLCLALREAKADVLGIPADERFPSARYPYARLVDGCTEWRQPTKDVKSWGGVDFSGACQAHDQCFHSIGKTWGECNQDYLRALRNSCERDLTKSRLEASKHGAPDAQALHLCFEIADLYFSRVQEAGAIKRWELAQKQEAAYLAHVRSTVQRAYVSMLRRPATVAEENEALKRLDSGTTLAELRAALRSGAADRKARLAAMERASELPVIEDTALRGLVTESPE